MLNINDIRREERGEERRGEHFLLLSSCYDDAQQILFVTLSVGCGATRSEDRPGCNLSVSYAC